MKTVLQGWIGQNAVVGFLMIFMGGFVAALNLALLIPHDPGYRASWIKVGACACIAVAGAFLSKSNSITNVKVIPDKEKK